MLAGVGGVFPPVAWIADAATDLHEAMPSPGYFLITCLFVSGIAIAHGARRRRRVTSEDPANSRGWTAGWLLAFTYGLVGWAVVFNLNHAEREHRTRKGEADEKAYGQLVVHVRQTLRRMQVCLLEYDRAHPKAGFPDSLSAVGPGGTGCFDSTKYRDVLAHAQMRYLGTRSDSASRIRPLAANVDARA